MCPVSFRIQERGRGKPEPQTTRENDCTVHASTFTPRGRNLEDGGRGGATEAAGRVEGIDAEELVDEAAGDAEHGGAAVLALGVELEGLGLRIVVAHPAVTANVSRRLLADVRVALILEEEVARL